MHLEKGNYISILFRAVQMIAHFCKYYILFPNHLQLAQ